MKEFNTKAISDTKNFIVLPNDKVTIDDITLKIPFFCGLSVMKMVDSYEIRITKVDKLDKFNF